MPSELIHTSWSAIEPEQLNPLLTRQFVSGSEAMVSRLVLTKGCIVPRHSRPNEQISTIVSGALKFLLGEDENDLREEIIRAGELLVIPGNLPHSAEALEDTVNIDIFAPPRQDWLNKTDSYLR